ncbi:hypothetical protein BLA29_009710 [Euroglyphus maynei]|uniref:peptidyl-tRNA hydrolase n=1 Tax=Euroglyphus maynei TaxID=6958 RepID=A0A1Y3BJQ2_EURMA|nr:hypothetical protein BLA29_009710 [Euroglyphus maynei]
MNVEDSWILAPILFGFAIGFRLKPTPLRLISWRQKLVIIVNMNDNVCRSNNRELLSYCSKVSIMAFETSKKQTPISHYLWSMFGQPKIVLQTNSEQNFENFSRQASESMICSTILRNHNGRKIILAIGPGPNSTIDRITGHLKLL